MNNEMPRPPSEIDLVSLIFRRGRSNSSAPSPGDSRHLLIALVFGTVSNANTNQDFQGDMKPNEKPGAPLRNLLCCGDGFV